MGFLLMGLFATGRWSVFAWTKASKYHSRKFCISMMTCRKYCFSIMTSSPAFKCKQLTKDAVHLFDLNRVIFKTQRAQFSQKSWNIFNLQKPVWLEDLPILVFIFCLPNFTTQTWQQPRQVFQGLKVPLRPSEVYLLPVTFTWKAVSWAPANHRVCWGWQSNQTK